MAKPKPGIHLLNAHYVSPLASVSVEVFKGFLANLSQIAKFIRFEEAVARIRSHNVPKEEILVAFSYDDGFDECYTHIAPALEEYDCNACFFVNANYIESDEIYKSIFNSRIETYSKKPMTWKHVSDLHKRGHIIGSHTLDHLNLAACSMTDADCQIYKNKIVLQERLNYSCDYFAWPYGKHIHFNSHILDLVEKYHPHIFSATESKKYFSYNGRVFNRRHIECFWPQSHVKFFLDVNRKF